MNKQNWLDTFYLDGAGDPQPILLNMAAYRSAMPADGGTHTQLILPDGTNGEKLNLSFTAFAEALTLIGANIYTPPAEV